MIKFLRKRWFDLLCGIALTSGLIYFVLSPFFQLGIKERCIDGVTYLKGYAVLTVKVQPDGKPVTCEGNTK